jgi:hypothetical protein
MLEAEDWIALLIILSFVAFISGLVLGASLPPFSPYRRHNARKPREAQHPRLVLAVVLALVVVSGVIVVDQFKGPLFPAAFYYPSDGGTQPNTQQSRVTLRPPLPMDVRRYGPEDD